MNKWYQIFHRSTGLSPYVWVVFCILPFYFIFRSSSTPEVISGIIMIGLFFFCYRMSFVSKGWLIYFWTSVQIIISIAMTVLFDYVYFSIFLAFYIGNIKSRAGFFTLYAIHLLSTFITVNYGFATQNPLFFTQFPFILISLIVVILLPFNTYNQNKQGQLEGQLEDANKRISELVKLEERQRIARDLHDTLGQKLSLIGLKSDLASKLIRKNPDRAQSEILDVQQTARTALKEVREMVTQMRGIRLDEEMHRVVQILGVAEMELTLEGDPKLTNTTLLTENVLSMCLKEAVTNVVRHSHAKHCFITIASTSSELTLSIRDDGVGMTVTPGYYRGNGLRGMKERLEFVNGSLEILSESGTEMIIKVPHVVKQPVKEISE
ncbi:sensor histidine kinase [Paenibacillus sp. L3-i20]|uniref:sensor histidine kinase n=1 Tax=Paenibacillus sp. L3-i20 TaxID=2905833 RepID=UPI001EDD1DDF|nr:sensor histidine kinase [Paenibacillus sp. L3-i20]